MTNDYIAQMLKDQPDVPKQVQYLAGVITSLSARIETLERQLKGLREGLATGLDTSHG